MVTCYEEPTKTKSQTVLRAFAAGCGGKMASTTAKELEPGTDSAFYGVRPGWMKLWEQACSIAPIVRRPPHFDWYYIDNAYFDCVREKHFRITRNDLQCGNNSVWDRDPKRFHNLGLMVHEWKPHGKHIIFCPQSQEFMNGVGGFTGDWLQQATAAVRQHTDRPFVIRKKDEARPLAQDLVGAWALVTHMSCAAVEALLYGVPVFCTGNCAAQIMGLSDLTMIESPSYPERREYWAEKLASNQWTLDEMKNGTAWRALSNGH